ncbi:MAG: 1-(5-phosphoribosyl)-5-[(5-phosphoribosylamino)methylideneamino]imidazole-4-carboxamide isomerase [Dehalococcoidia bacterium]|nr:1-(5-phosphoribosyl)-5-[(5-phosphoribosylamino)methylideneamino]imidazole-4-carboxamide isomerase [Dehalococcoidia bacterium]
MEIIPAIDIKNGLCVRLYQGDFNRQTVFSDDPIDVALRWENAGARRIHIVDLDGSRTGLQINLDIIKSIKSSINVPLQVGGGIRDLKTAQILLSFGIDRVVIGTAAIENPDMVQHLCNIWGSQRIVVALDAKGEQIAIKGWIKETSVSVSTLATHMASIGVHRFLYTDILRDGTMTSPNFEGIQKLISDTSKQILASGGVSSLDDVEKLANIGAEGVILGSALYKGNICLEEAIRIADQDR